MGGRDSARETWSGLVNFDSLPGRTPRQRAEALFAGRRIRDGLFPVGLFGEQAWDILLELFIQRGQDGIPINQLCRFTKARDTLNRYVALLSDLGIVDKANVNNEESVSLTTNGLDLMHEFFAVTDGRSVTKR